MSQPDVWNSAIGKWISRGAHALALVLAALGALCVVFATVSITADTILRNFFDESFPGVVEINEVMMVGITFLGFAYAERVRAHIGVEVATSRMSPRVLHPVRLVGLLAVFGPLLWMLYATAQTAAESYSIREYRFGLTEVPIWPARIAIPVGLGAFLILFAMRIVDEVVATWSAWTSRVELGVRDAIPDAVEEEIPLV